MRYLALVFFLTFFISSFASKQLCFKENVLIPGVEKIVQDAAIDSVLKKYTGMSLNQYFSLAYSKYYKLNNYQGVKTGNDLKSGYVFEIFDHELPEVYLDQKLLLTKEIENLRKIEKIKSVIEVKYTNEQLAVKKSKSLRRIIIKI
jgi:hypothetical protein